MGNPLMRSVPDLDLEIHVDLDVDLDVDPYVHLVLPGVIGARLGAGHSPGTFW